MASKLFDGLRAAKDTALAVAPGLKDLVPDVKAEMKDQAAHGAHEMAAALFNGNAFVMYPRGGKDDHGKEGHGVHGPEQPHTQDQGRPQDTPGQNMERGGRGM
jgi:hypothetical protein